MHPIHVWEEVIEKCGTQTKEIQQEFPSFITT
jgi:hypothetical protein